MRGQISGEVRFLFQHAEEAYPGGAEEMVRAGAMEGVDAVTGIHLWSGLPAGKVGIVHGPMMASPDKFEISVKGDGGHAAMPHQTVDANAIGAQVVTNLQHVVSCETDPTENVVVSVTKFVGGTTHNVVPGTVEMTGTVRTLKPEVRDRVPGIMERIVKGITAAHGASYSFEYQRGYRPVINDDGVTGIVERTARETLGDEAVEIMSANMGGEDFSAFQQAAPGTFFLVGAGNEESIVYPHHHPCFGIDESALTVGVRMFVFAAFELLDARRVGK